MKILKTALILMLTLFAFQHAKAQVWVICPPLHPCYNDPCCCSFSQENTTDCYFELSFTQSCGSNCTSVNYRYEFPAMTTACNSNKVIDNNGTDMDPPDSYVTEICVRDASGSNCYCFCLGGGSAGTVTLPSAFNRNGNSVSITYDLNGTVPGYSYPILVRFHY